MSSKKNTVDPSFDVKFKEFERRVKSIVNLCDEGLARITRHFCAILSVCDNIANQHFAENALTLFTFVAHEFEALLYGYLTFEGQERYYKGFISKQCGSFDEDTVRSNRADMSVRLTFCCVDHLSNEVTIRYFSSSFLLTTCISFRQNQMMF